MDKELKKRVTELAIPSNKPDGSKNHHAWHTLNLGTPGIDIAATLFLADLGYLMPSPTGGGYRITAQGREYWERINTWTPWYWYKTNWFPATVALATLLVGFSTVAVHIWRVISTSCS